MSYDYKKFKNSIINTDYTIEFDSGEDDGYIWLNIKQDNKDLVSFQYSIGCDSFWLVSCNDEFLYPNQFISTKLNAEETVMFLDAFNIFLYNVGLAKKNRAIYGA